MLNDDQRAMRVLLANTLLQRWRNEGTAFLDRILTVDESWMHSFDPQLKQQNAEWRVPMSSRNKIARRSQGALKVMHVMFFS
jgi:uracil DNA glycosylase